MRLQIQSRRRGALAMPAFAVLLGLAGCATVADPRAPRDPVGEAVTQPLRDLSLVQGELPPGLRTAVAKPYRPLSDCASLRTELAALDGWLGPDVDAADAARDGAAGLLGDVVTGAASLPFRGVVRRASGARDRDQAIAAVVLAAMVRRGFLKGERVALGCAEPGA